MRKTEDQTKLLQTNQKKKEPEQKITYSNVLTSSTGKTKLRRENQEETLKLPITTTARRKTEVFNEYLSNISPSAISQDYLNYLQLDFDINDVPLKNGEFGIYHKFLVEIFTEQMNYDEQLIFAMVNKQGRKSP